MKSEYDYSFHFYDVHGVLLYQISANTLKEAKDKLKRMMDPYNVEQEIRGGKVVISLR